ncbi:MAG: universal stress protein [Myxococcota bacterium]
MPLSAILVPVDFSDASRKALDTAVEIAKGVGARIEIIFAQEVLTYRGVRYEEVLSLKTRAEQREEAEQALEEWTVAARAGGVKASHRIIDGDARQVIVKTASETGADLIVLGAKGRSRVADILVGSVATETARSAPCSVMLVR